MWSCGLRDGGCCLIVTYLKKIDKDLSISTGLIAVTVSFNPLRGKIPKHFRSSPPSSSLPSFLSFPMLSTQYTPHPTTPPSTFKSNSLHPYPSAHLLISHHPLNLPSQTNEPTDRRPINPSFFHSLSLSLSP